MLNLSFVRESDVIDCDVSLTCDLWISGVIFLFTIVVALPVETTDVDCLSRYGLEFGHTQLETRLLLS